MIIGVFVSFKKSFLSISSAYSGPDELCSGVGDSPSENTKKENELSFCSFSFSTLFVWYICNPNNCL